MTNENVNLNEILARLNALEAENKALKAAPPVVAPPVVSADEWCEAIHYYGFPCKVRRRDLESDKELSVFTPFMVEKTTVVFVEGDEWHDGKKLHAVGPSLFVAFAGVVNQCKQFKASWDCPTLRADCGVDSSKRDFVDSREWRTKTTIGRLMPVIEFADADGEIVDWILIRIDAVYRKDDLQSVRFRKPETLDVQTWNGEVYDILNEWFDCMEIRSDKSGSRRSAARRHRSAHR